jgi:hypothetical protein
MKKLRLDVDALQVDGFETAAEASARGTVQGRQTQPTDPLYWPSCQQTCGMIGDSKRDGFLRRPTDWCCV